MQQRDPHWSFALSDARGQIQFYRSNIPTDDGVDYGQEIASDVPMWDAVIEKDQLAAAWAECWATGQSQKLTCHAIRNGRRVELELFRIPVDDAFSMVSHGVWSQHHEVLTDQETQICQLLTSGVTPQEIAATLEISTSTVSRCRSEAMRKLGCNTYEQLGTRFC